MTKQERARRQRRFLLGFERFGTCARCGRARKLHADHIIPVTMGGSWEASNRQGLCRVCHGRKTQQEYRDPFTMLEEAP